MPEPSEVSPKSVYAVELSPSTTRIVTLFFGKNLDPVTINWPFLKTTVIDGAGGGVGFGVGGGPTTVKVEEEKGPFPWVFSPRTMSVT